MDPFDGGMTLRYNLRETKKPVKIKLSSKREEQLDNLLDSWDFETKEFVRGFLKPHLDIYYRFKRPKLRDKFVKKDGVFKYLKNPKMFKNWEERLKVTGEKNARLAFEKILKKELTYYDTTYLVHKLNEELTDVVVPQEMVDVFHKIYVAHLKKEMTNMEGVPKKPFVLVVGPTGAGKTHTIKGAIEQAVFNNELKIEKDYDEEREKIIEDHPWANIPFATWCKTLPALELLEQEEALMKKIKRYRSLVKMGWFKKHYQEKLKELEERLDEVDREYESLKVDYSTISPHQIQTMWYGETGNKFKDAMGHPKIPSIRHIIEAHGILRKPDSRGHSSDVQSITLSATVNKIMDEITDGERDCIFIADTHSPENIAPDTYRRFDEQGVIIDVSKFWRKKLELERVINLETKRKNVRLKQDLSKQVTDKVYDIFNKKSLIITPAYVRKLIASIIEKKGGLKLEYFGDDLLIRQAFENVAMNSYGDLYKKIVKRPKAEEGFAWEDYVGNVKEDVLEMVTSTLLYGGEDKGVVLTGPPGSGKTFLAQVIAATHPEISYISVKMDDLQQEGLGLEGIIQNIDGLYNIAKMLAPSIIVINEGDAVLKQRSEQGSNPYDKITNKFLDILDGEESIKGTFTIVTTNLFENLDKAITRPGRLKVLAVEGKLAKEEVYKIIKKELTNEPKDKDISYEKIYTVAKSINNVPAGYVDFVRKLKSLRKTDINIIDAYKKIFEEENGKQA